MSTNIASEYTTIVSTELEIIQGGVPTFLEILNRCGYDDTTILDHDFSTNVRIRNGIPTLTVGFDYICVESGDVRDDGEVHITCRGGKWVADYSPVW